MMYLLKLVAGANPTLVADTPIHIFNSFTESALETDPAVWYEVGGRRFVISSADLPNFEMEFDFNSGWKSTCFVCPITRTPVLLTELKTTNYVGDIGSIQLQTLNFFLDGLTDATLQSAICQFFAHKFFSAPSKGRQAEFNQMLDEANAEFERLQFAGQDPVETPRVFNIDDNPVAYLVKLGVITDAVPGEVGPVAELESPNKLTLSHMFPGLVDIFLRVVHDLVAEENSNLPSTVLSSVDISHSGLTTLPQHLLENPEFSAAIETLTLADNPGFVLDPTQWRFENLVRLNVSKTAPANLAQLPNVLKKYGCLQHVVAQGPFANSYASVAAVYAQLPARRGSLLCDIDLTIFDPNLPQAVFDWLVTFNPNEIVVGRDACERLQTAAAIYVQKK